MPDAEGGFLANAALASRKDARDAVQAARKAFPGWSGATAYNRGQILYRVAEMLEGRRAQFVDEVARGEGVAARKAEPIVDAAIDRWVWYAGWADKVAQVLGGANPVAGPYFNFSLPEPTGVVAVVAPQDSSLLGLVIVIAPAIVDRQHRGRRWPSRDAPAARPSPWPRCSPPPTCPGGVVNLLTGPVAESRPGWPSHMDVNAIDLTGVADA